MTPTETNKSASIPTESVTCYYCDHASGQPFIEGEDDYTGRPGTFSYVKCDQCCLVYQNPRLPVAQIKTFYDDQYISHRKQQDWGLFTPFYNYAMGKHDRDKLKLVAEYVSLSETDHVLDVGCAVGTFLTQVKKKWHSTIVGVDFKDVTYYPGFDQIEFHQGLLYQQDIGIDRFKLATMWHFLEHCYDPMASLKHVNRALQDDGRLIIEVPRLDSLSFKIFRDRWPGIQAPQHTMLLERDMLLKMVEKAGFEVVDYLPYGAFPPYMYLFAGAAFKILKGKGLNMRKSIVPYFSGQLLLTPILLFARYLNLAMQTVVCKPISKG